MQHDDRAGRHFGSDEPRVDRGRRNALVERVNVAQHHRVAVAVQRPEHRVVEIAVAWSKPLLLHPRPQLGFAFQQVRFERAFAHRPVRPVFQPVVADCMPFVHDSVHDALVALDVVGKNEKDGLDVELQQKVQQCVGVLRRRIVEREEDVRVRFVDNFFVQQWFQQVVWQKVNVEQKKEDDQKDDVHFFMFRF